MVNASSDAPHALRRFENSGHILQMSVQIV